MKRNQMEHKGFYGTVEWSEEDKVFYGKVIGVNDLLLYEGETIDELRKMFYEYVDDYIEECRKDGIAVQGSYKGSFNVRIDPDLHRKAAEKAAEEDISLNRLVGKALREYLK